MKENTDVAGSDYRWERSEHPHRKMPVQYRTQFLPDVIWLRIHKVWKGKWIDEVTGWRKTDPKSP
jgi:hypothetical protein